MIENSIKKHVENIKRYGKNPLVEMSALSIAGTIHFLLESLESGETIDKEFLLNELRDGFNIAPEETKKYIKDILGEYAMSSNEVTS